MKFFDAHCDTILKVVEDGEDPMRGEMHVTLPALRAGGICAQVFACFVLEARNPGVAREHALELVGAVRQLCSSHPDRLVLADTSAVLSHACTEDPRTAVIVSLEGADPLEGDVEALRLFHDRGVRLLTLAWDDNEFCGAAFGESGAGLSAAGADLVALCEELGVMVDVSHASDAGFWDVHRLATCPFVASHSNCRAVCPASRNLDDDMIVALAERGGVMGLNLSSGFLSPEFMELHAAVSERFWAAVRSGEKTFDEAGEVATRETKALPRPSLELVGAHIRHAINVGGEDCVGIGGDLDGIDSMPAGIETAADYPVLADTLAAAGLSDAQIEKVCYRNFARVMTQT